MTVRVVAPPPPPPGPHDADAVKLFDYAVAHPDGYTREDVQQAFGWGRSHAVLITRIVRGMLASEPENLVCEQEVPQAPWVYRLTADPEHVNAWTGNRLGDSDTRLETIMFIAQSEVKATDGRTYEGKRARLIERGMRHLLEDLEALRDAS